jgi:hypothetical protein
LGKSVAQPVPWPYLCTGTAGTARRPIQRHRSPCCIATRGRSGTPTSFPRLYCAPHRSFARITPNGLARLAQIALDDLADLCRRQKYSRRYADGLRLICLCQGAARHYVYHDRGVWDFDLWGFFQEVRGHPFPYRRRGEHDFGPSNLGETPTMEIPSRGVR